MEFKKIKYSVTDGIATIILNSPNNLNAFDVPMIEDLLNALDMCTHDDNVKVIVISGEGKGFSAGGDIGMMLKGIESGNLVDLFDVPLHKIGSLALKLRSITKPIIASVHGPVAGGGANFALLCDFRVAADNVKFVQAFVNIGLVPDVGGIYVLTRLLGAAKATELVMTGRPVGAQEALSLGLVTEVVPMENLEEATLKLAKKLAALPSLSLAKMKTLVNRAAFQGLEAAINSQSEYQMLLTRTEDFKEGIYAFAEKRKPNFKGK